MKKLIFILTLLLLTSCGESFESDNKITSETLVPTDYGDSTKWKPAKVYLRSDSQMYVKIKGNEYDVRAEQKTFYIFLLIVGLGFGLMIGVKIGS